MTIQEVQRGRGGLRLDDSTAVSAIHQEVVNRNISVVGIEGPPIYAVPHPARRSQNWQSSIFQSGWNLANRLFTSIKASGLEVHHWVLVDDVNNTDSPAQPRVFSNTIRSIRSTLGFPAILADIRLRRAFLESRFSSSERENRCSNLDAAFQLKKLHYVQKQGFLDNHVQVIVHPVDFQQQQGLMLANLLAEMKRDSYFQRLSKQERRDFIEQVYLYAWVDDQGFMFTTRPRWDGQRFIFEEVSHAA